MGNNYNLPNNQAELVEKGEVFGGVITSKDSPYGIHPSSFPDGVVFTTSGTKLMSKDGSNNVLAAIGIDNYDGKVDGAHRSFMPTTFEELVTAFKFTSSKGLESFFRKKDETNTNLNALLCSFLRNNLSSQNVDVKELVSASFTIKDIIDKKAEVFYESKVDFFAKKIQKYQSKIDSLKLEQSGFDEFGEVLADPECETTELVADFIDTLDEDSQSQTDVKVGVEDVLSYFDKNKKANQPEAAEESVDGVVQVTNAMQPQEQ